MTRPISRRNFCLAMGTGCAALVLPGCDTAAPGPAGDGNDLLVSPGSDMKLSCPPGTAVATGAATLPVGQSVHLSSAGLFVLRDDSGLYALTDTCTHEGFEPIAYNRTSRQFRCPLHGSMFDQNGNVILGPAIRQLPHYAICVNGGDVVVDTDSIVDGDERK